jgi:tRNA (guanine26-N2/guanine27-N2)-dimethyltransferase
MQESSFEFDEVKEGLAVLLVPKLEMYRQSPNEYVPSRAPVFYNPLMKENRDLAIAFLRQIRKEANEKIFFGEPLTGTGVRGIRAVLEAGVEHAWINDISKLATNITKVNVQRNKVENFITIENMEANIFNLSHNSEFDFLDLDPFGSPSPYLESSIRAVRNGGILAVTATDTATLCGVYPDKAKARYGGRSLKTVFPKEFAARLLIYGIVSVAARIGVGAKPLLSYASRNYVRIYCRLKRGNREAAKAMAETGHILYCKYCFNREGLRASKFHEMINLSCKICGRKMDLAGPIWIGQHSDPSIARLILNQTDKSLMDPKITKILRLLSLEDTETIGSYPIPKISQYCRRSPPSKRLLLSRLKTAGIEACEASFEENAIKTRVSINQIVKYL